MMAKKAKTTVASSRWFRVTGERFDWFPRRNVIVAFKRGDIGYRPMACIEAGLAQGVIELIGKPAGATVAKDGTVRLGH